jgi:hypothetical protein
MVEKLLIPEETDVTASPRRNSWYARWELRKHSGTESQTTRQIRKKYEHFMGDTSLFVPHVSIPPSRPCAVPTFL